MGESSDPFNTKDEMMKNITLHFHGRPAKVGDLFNYFTDNIISSISSDSAGPLDILHYQFPQIKTTCSYDIYLTDELKSYMIGMNSHLKKSIEKHSINTDYLWFSKYLQSLKEDDELAKVSAFFRITHSKDTLKIEDYTMMRFAKESDGCATHLVEEVVYGAELLLSMQRKIDKTTESKDSVEEAIFLAAKSYFNQIITIAEDNSSVELPKELREVTCTTYGTLDHVLENNCFEQLRHFYSMKNYQTTKWKPIQISLRYLSNQIRTRVYLETQEDFSSLKENLEIVLKKSETLSGHQFLNRIPPLKKALHQFHNLLLKKLFAQVSTNLQIRTHITWDLLTNITEWLINQRKKCELIGLLLNNETKLPVMDWGEIEAKISSGKKAKLFVLKIEYEGEDPLIEKLKKILKIQEVIQLPVFPITSVENRTALKPYSQKLKEFEEHHNMMIQFFPNLNSSCYVALVTGNTSFKDGEILEMPLQKIGSESLTNIVSHEQYYNISEAALNHTETITNRNEQNSNPTTISEMLINEEHSELIYSRNPKVYLLKLKTYKESHNHKLYETMLNPNQIRDESNHKYIIMLGNTGAGKSTMINEMVNYILCVQRTNPYRFKITREDNTDQQSQAYSQTRSVMSYTIHHHHDMAIPYSITIIDTPGYQDIGGSARDKEVTEAIRIFLTDSDTRIDRIDAICFVATSSNCVLTPSQRYIFESIISTFDKAVQENIQLLVTFSDCAEPLFVKSIVGTYFPRNPDTGGIQYYNFNNLTDYSSMSSFTEEQEGETLAWDMSHNSFEQLFENLQTMTNGQDLVFTRKIINEHRMVQQELKTVKEKAKNNCDRLKALRILEGKIMDNGELLDSGKHHEWDEKTKKFKITLQKMVEIFKHENNNREPTSKELAQKCRKELSVIKTEVSSLICKWDNTIRSFEPSYQHLVDRQSKDEMERVKSLVVPTEISDVICLRYPTINDDSR